MKRTIITAMLATFAAAVSLPAMAYEDDTTIYGRTPQNLASTLNEQGYAVSSVEQWGTYVRGWVVNEDGTTTMQMFDAETLQPVAL